MCNGTVSVCFQADTEEELQEMTEQIIAAIEALNLPVSISEDSWDD